MRLFHGTKARFASGEGADKIAKHRKPTIFRPYDPERQFGAAESGKLLRGNLALRNRGRSHAIEFEITSGNG